MVGQSLIISVYMGGTANQYQWIRNGGAIAGATAGTYPIASAGPSNEGKYACRIRNTITMSFTLNSGTIRLMVGDGTGIAKSPQQIPAVFVLHPNYPNPFNQTTRIKYNLPEVGPDDHGEKASSGVYVYRIKTGHVKHSYILTWKIHTHEKHNS